MTMGRSTFGAIAGAVVALIVLAVVSVWLLNSPGANYKVLVAVWLWCLPVLGLFAGVGYGAGKVVDAIGGVPGRGAGGGRNADA